MDNSKAVDLDESANSVSASAHSNKAALDEGSHIMTSVSPVLPSPVEEYVSYRLYKRRFLGLVALVRIHNMGVSCTEHACL